MSEKSKTMAVDPLPLFDRDFLSSDKVGSRIGDGAIGGKATGLAIADRIIRKTFGQNRASEFIIGVPRFVVIATEVFDAFIRHNHLGELLHTGLPDDRIANAFQQAEFPAAFAGDLRSLATVVHYPLAIRSSSMLEDDMYEPFAGVYETKMTPNNQSDSAARYKKIVEAIKFVYASTYFRQARAYMKMIGRTPDEEKMAVIIQEVVGARHGDRFYPNVAGVGRSFNFYTFGHAAPEDGIVDLALGLGRTIVDGGLVWTYCPAYPKSPPPYAATELLKNTQSQFWAVNMGKPPGYDPIREAEFLVECSLKEAEYDDTLSQVVSTYQAENDRFVPGTSTEGPRMIDFAPLLRFHDDEFNAPISKLLAACTEELGNAVEIEFAATIHPKSEPEINLGLVQVRPMVVSHEEVELPESELESERALAASDRTLGNGIVNDIIDIVYIKPETFEKENTRLMAAEIDKLNELITNDGRKFVLIGFGRWGSSDAWLGIPVAWDNISGAQVLVEATLPEMDVEISQGSHFFHNITSLRLIYMSVRHSSEYKIDWSWLDSQEVVSDLKYTRHIRVTRPLTVKVDGRTGMGVILK
jgi:hypothetical protein